MSVDAASLRELHRLHRQLSDLRGRLARGPKQLKASAANIARLDEQLQQTRETAKRTRMTIDDKELQLKEREGRIQDVRARLNSCSSNREYQAFLEQIAADEQANSVLSDEIIELLDKISGEQTAIGQAEAQLAAAKEEEDKLRKRIDTEKDSCENEVARVDGDLKKAEKALPADVRQEYERVAKSLGEEALAPVEGDVCGGCYQRITPQMLNELGLSKVVFCKSCGRLLYPPEDTAVGQV